MAKYRKKGQAEDIFADLLPALAIIVVAVIIVGTIKQAHNEEIQAKIKSAGNLPLKSAYLLKAPVDLPKMPKEYKGLSLGEIAGAIAIKSSMIEQKQEGLEWLEESGIASDSFSAEQAILKYYGSSGMMDCSSDFRQYLHKILLGSDKKWGYLLDPLAVMFGTALPPDLWMVELYRLTPLDKKVFYVCVSPFGNYNFLLNIHKGDAKYQRKMENFTIPSQDPSRQIVLSVSFLTTKK